MNMIFNPKLIIIFLIFFLNCKEKDKIDYSAFYRDLPRKVEAPTDEKSSESLEYLANNLFLVQYKCPNGKTHEVESTFYFDIDEFKKILNIVVLETEFCNDSNYGSVLKQINEYEIPIDQIKKESLYVIEEPPVGKGIAISKTYNLNFHSKFNSKSFKRKYSELRVVTRDGKIEQKIDTVAINHIQLVFYENSANKIENSIKNLINI